MKRSNFGTWLVKTFAPLSGARPDAPTVEQFIQRRQEEQSVEAGKVKAATAPGTARRS